MTRFGPPLPSVPRVPSPVLGTGEPAEYPPGSWNLTAEAERYASEALDEVRMGETYWFTLGPAVMPEPTTGQPAVGMVIVVYGRSPLLGHPPLTAGCFQVGFPTRHEITTAVHGLVGQLRREASTLTSRQP